MIDVSADDEHDGDAAAADDDAYDDDNDNVLRSRAAGNLLCMLLIVAIDSQAQIAASARLSVAFAICAFHPLCVESSTGT